ncbi:Lnp1p NDAI_0D03290 [Naumovozyma dairenensis CBS 421]|uniref:Endoplasmic reticulum junction formation protein lunapark n=1 Tax=Naumovozyma dairenensis (strain ATCC 10597 / BCRC 20456 / CBS 421 / NBRC 0211 / NRRL Y-12639) TaxID=1071378 RepID=G0WA32_NAUDC|nr:hypothetical protein NDAI_0D03290 [Naumovozyma dairenensis CBS 421]CCD24643.1 hypothetical protein NDAI_0D03290 [Naumovozyma dairenensis CBS 421]
MLRTISTILSKVNNTITNSKKTLIQRYTEDLSHITSQIHALESSLQRRQAVLDHFQSQLTFYGLSAIVCLASAAYYYSSSYSENEGNTEWVWITVLVLGVILLGFLKWVSYKLEGWYKERQDKKLSKLRATHSKKLESLKRETQFHETNSIIQRFSSGSNQDDDAMVLMDEQLSAKYDEFNQLKNELNKLQKDNEFVNNKEKSDVWFDKVIGILAGGNDLNNTIRPIVCSNCKRHTGAYRLLNKPLQYVCPVCGCKLDETIKNQHEEREPSAVDTIDTKDTNDSNKKTKKSKKKNGSLKKV